MALLRELLVPGSNQKKDLKRLERKQNVKTKRKMELKDKAQGLTTREAEGEFGNLMFMKVA